MQPYLFIGVGGTGGKTLRYVWREIRRRVEATSWEKPHAPQCFGYLHIDLPNLYDGGAELDIPVVRDLEVHHYLGLGQRGVEYAVYDEQITRNSAMDGILRWRPWPLDRIPDPARGAGQRRAVGRVVAMARRQAIRDRVRAAMDTLKSDEAERDLRELAQLFPTKGPQGHGHVVIVGSLAGGTGSSIILDVVDAVRSSSSTAFEGHKTPHTFLVASDVFRGVGPDAGIYPNALAALAELVNATDVPEQHGNGLRPTGGVTGPSGSRLGRSNFVVGASNGTVTFRSPREVYQAVGRMLGALALSPRHQQTFDHYIDVNAPETPLHRGLGKVASFSSVGYAVVGLGRHLFGTYATERIARHTFERLLRGHEERDLDRPPEDRLERRVKHLWPHFQAATSLEGERIMFALQEPELVRQNVQKQKADVVGEIKENRGRQRGEDWQKRHAGAWARTQEKADADEEQRLAKAFQRWAEGVQRHLVTTVVETVAREGLPVGVALLERLYEEMDETAGQLQEQIREYEAKTDRATQLSEGELVKRRKLPSDAPEHDRSAKWRGQARFCLYARNATELTRRQLEDMRSNLVRPLRDTLKGALDRLRIAETEEPTKSQVQRWTTGPVPAHLMPAANEFLIEPATEFPRQFDELLEATFDRPPGNALQSATQEAIIGRWPGRHGRMVDGQAFVRSIGNWVPADGPVYYGADGSTAAAFDTAITPDVLLADIDRWLRQRSGPFGRFLEETLERYLADDVAGSRRATAFVKTFEQALAKSKPFVHVDADVSLALHSDPGEDTHTSVSPIPVAKAPGTVLYDQLVQILEASGIPSGSAIFDATQPVAEVDVIRYPKAKFHPAALRSVTRPIAEDWANRKAQPVDRSEFWNSRRSASLPRYIPLPIEQQLALVRGWFVACLLGYVNLPKAKRWSHEEREVWSPEKPLPLPQFLLVASGDEPKQTRHILPALLESFPLSWLDFKTDRAVLPAYERLIELGTIDDGLYHEELADWVRDGTRPRGRFDYPADVMLEGHDHRSRKEELIAWLDELQRSIREAPDGTTPTPASKPSSVDSLSEVSQLTSEALEQLTKAISTGDQGPGPIL